MGIINVVIAYNFIRDLTRPFKDTEAYKNGIIDENGVFLVREDDLSPNQRKYYPNIITILAWNIKRILSKIGIGKSSIASFATALYLLRAKLEDKKMKSSRITEDILNVLERDIYSMDRSAMINEAFGSILCSPKITRGSYRVFDEDILLHEDIKPKDYSLGLPLYEAFVNGKKIVFSENDLSEEVPTNNVGSGMVKGIAPGEEPPVRARRKKIYELMGRYTVFEISPEDFERCSCAKKKFEKWNKFFDEDSETGSEIKKYSYNNPEKGIILRNSETGQTMMFRRRWSDQRLTHNKKAKVLVQSNEKVYSIWTR